MLALPPGVGAASIDFEPPLPAAQRRKMATTASWCGDWCKVVATFRSPFWRARAASGVVAAAGPAQIWWEAGGGAELAGLADYAQSVLGVPVRIGKPAALKGLPEAHTSPAFTTLAGLVLYAAEDPIDIRAIGSRFTSTASYGPLTTLVRAWTAMREDF